MGTGIQSHAKQISVRLTFVAITLTLLLRSTAQQRLRGPILIAIVVVVVDVAQLILEVVDVVGLGREAEVPLRRKVRVVDEPPAARVRDVHDGAGRGAVVAQPAVLDAVVEEQRVAARGQRNDGARDGTLARVVPDGERKRKKKKTTKDEL